MATDNTEYFSIALSDLPDVHEDVPGQLRVWLGNGNLVRDSSWTRERLLAEARALIAMAYRIDDTKREVAERELSKLELVLKEAGINIPSKSRDAVVQGLIDTDTVVLQEKPVVTVEQVDKPAQT